MNNVNTQYSDFSMDTDAQLTSSDNSFSVQMRSCRHNSTELIVANCDLRHIGSVLKSSQGCQCKRPIPSCPNKTIYLRRHITITV